MNMSISAFLLSVLLLGSSSHSIRVIPTTYPARVLRTEFNTCPTKARQEEVTAVIKDDLKEIIHQVVLTGLQCDLGECENNPALSCSQIIQENSTKESGLYWLKRLDGIAVQVYCAMDNPCSYNSTVGAWMRIAYLNMSNTAEECPHGMILNEEPRSCSRSAYQGACVSVFFSSNFMQYNKVCGRINAYQDISPDAFWPYINDQTRTIDDPYVDGISLTYGFSPRKHIWTFAAGVEDVGNSPFHCPCSSPSYRGVVPSFINNDYFCESAELSPRFQNKIYSDNPLWDGAGCAQTSTCCSLNNPPWFYKSLPEPTRDNIEIRTCSDQHQNDEEVLLSMLEIYVQ